MILETVTFTIILLTGIFVLAPFYPLTQNIPVGVTDLTCCFGIVLSKYMYYFTTNKGVQMVSAICNFLGSAILVIMGIVILAINSLFSSSIVVATLNIICGFVNLCLFFTQLIYGNHVTVQQRTNV